MDWENRLNAGDIAGADERVVVDQEACIGCGQCLKSCPTDVFRLDKHGAGFLAAVAYPDDCCDCFLCVGDCPVDAITVHFHPPTFGFSSVYAQMGIELQHASWIDS